LDELQPKRALLTHVSHFMGLHDEVNIELPTNIQLAFDGQQIILST
jgi:phosphoribosyl 1,2-cyclic phosphate phosphodiesterase